MDDKKRITDALNCLRPQELEYDEWLHIGMALKEAGIDYSVWDEWSSSDPKKYHDGECKRKWDGFSGSNNPVTVATIFKMAKEKGYSTKRVNKALDWNDTITDDGNTKSSKPLKPTEQLKQFLSILFDPEDKVGLVTGDVWQSSDGKWNPSKGEYDRTAAELIKSLDAHPDDLGATIGDWKEECGAWIRFNPLDGNGVKNENVTKFKYALVESDEMSIADQETLYRKLQLPIATLTYSGGKSLHAIVRVDAINADEYRKRVDYLYDYLEKNGAKVDKQNRNPSRLTRMPGVTRRGKEQKLLAVNVGKKNYYEWVDAFDDFPKIVNLRDALQGGITVRQELIEGVLRYGHKMLVTGPSKAGKSFALMELAIAIAEGKKWLQFQCKKGKVLYLNLEIDKDSFAQRFKDVYDKLEIVPSHYENIDIWNLRGKTETLDNLYPKLIENAKAGNYDAIIVDPIYKVITGDENSASDMAMFCNLFDKICNETGSSLIFCHHQTKGYQGSKFAMDRASGSGVFARDPDAIVVFTQLDIRNLEESNDKTAWRVEVVTREFRQPKPFNCWFDWPIHIVDEAGRLSESKIAKGAESKAEQTPRSKMTPNERRVEFVNAYTVNDFTHSGVLLKDLAIYLNVSTKTIKRRVKEFEDEFELSGNTVKRTENPTQTDPKNEPPNPANPTRISLLDEA